MKIKSIINSLKEIPKAIKINVEEVSKPNSILIKLDGQENTVAVYNDNFIENKDLWEEKKQTIDRRLNDTSGGSKNGNQVGIEALAWYVSFHNNQKNWGIYIPISSLNYLNELFEIKVHAHTRLDQISKDLLLYHEQYHFAFDLFVSQIELLTNEPIFRAMLARYKNPSPIIGAKTYTAYNTIEENLANSFMLKRMINENISKSLLYKIENFISTQPPGYSDALKTLSSNLFEQITKENINNYLALPAVMHRLNLLDNNLDLSPLIPINQQNILDKCPVYILDDAKENGLDPDTIRFFQSMNEIKETRKFKKMLEKQPPVIKSDWNKKKKELLISIPKPPKFKKFKDFFALYLIQGFRVHFRKPERGSSIWWAEEINNHKAAGHG